ncbi:M15 family metallopeptidase [Microbispora siamensis]|uniref:Peptidase M15C domain-containing protein n=1 Tax=Microbispora siamensis TaxID=564413 RepID=A0ABQ4GNF7_9ACTN|nr:M15 family metallopeptidase [Microbispora siamensis]GIH62937.1 hypothetical protein Msi02_37540 [Microbispora siamensis]
MDTSRRIFLQSMAGLAVMSGVSAIIVQPAIAESAGPDPVHFTEDTLAQAQRAVAEITPGSKSPNGWSINTAANSGGSVWTRPVPGTAFGVDVALADAEVILIHVIRRFHYEIDTLRPGEVIGFKNPDTVKGYELNHASGTAIDIRPDQYPPGVHGGFYQHELAVVRDILAECKDIVKWGGDFTVPDEAHFEIAVPPTDSRLREFADQVRGWNSTPGVGAGVIQVV